MKGIVKINDGDVVHVIPRAEVRYAKIVPHGDDGYLLEYQLAGMFVERVEWQGDCRPPTLKTKIQVGEYNKIAAGAVQETITRGYRDMQLERRSDGMFCYRLSLIEEDTHVALCRKFIAEMVTLALQSAARQPAGPLGLIDDPRQQMLREIHVAARDLVLPEWYPLKEENPR